eukprot:CAMPEP_0178459818 /NCGR_PEP_ID=MMETSP0689_2-20121128/48345_1 /TAXON_ID=160604 /ORGANISM="Amphidinium massartii, Strain CS-259" /LENGTH=51 /DNA_ID=CAMNT_0020086345 /DNA_START=329 /DNA_END=484 /DNA_ORIENTATION=+
MKHRLEFRLCVWPSFAAKAGGGKALFAKKQAKKATQAVGAWCENRWLSPPR